MTEESRGMKTSDGCPEQSRSDAPAGDAGRERPSDRIDEMVEGRKAEGGRRGARAHDIVPSSWQSFPPSLSPSLSPLSSPSSDAGLAARGLHVSQDHTRIAGGLLHAEGSSYLG